MKTIIEKETKISKYLAEDNTDITITDENIVFPDFIVWDMNSGNAELIEWVEAPSDWVWCKYIYNEWFELNPDYTEPTEE